MTIKTERVMVPSIPFVMLLIIDNIFITWQHLANAFTFLNWLMPLLLQIVLTDWEFPSYHKRRANALYKNFSVGDKHSSYRLFVSDFSFLSGPLWESAGDSLEYSSGMQVLVRAMDFFNKLIFCFLSISNS